MERVEIARSAHGRRRGEAVSVAEIMKAAGLPHGGFYGHFGSKDDLIVQALGHAIDPGQGDPPDLCAFIDEYLSPRHRDNTAGGWALPRPPAGTLLSTPAAPSS